MTAYRIYGDTRSGNCLKVKWVADLAGCDYDWVDVDILKGETRTEEFLALNLAGQVPALVLPDGTSLAQSNAIIQYLGEAHGLKLLPETALQVAQMNSWLFWEQYSHETAIAVRRFHKAYLGKDESEIDPALLDKGHTALAIMEKALSYPEYLVGNYMTYADIALLAYTRMAEEGGFALAGYPHVQAWIARIEHHLGLPVYESEAA